MSDHNRLRTPDHVRSWLGAELRAARTEPDPWPALERAHIVSQPWAWHHTKVHALMLAAALRSRDRREAVGQLVRIVVAAPGSLAGRYPIGNTGRTTMRLTERAEVPADLQEVLQ